MTATGPWGYCEDYPACGHTDRDPCPGRGVALPDPIEQYAQACDEKAEAAISASDPPGAPVQEPWWCDDCGFYHVGLVCPGEES